jgi:glucose/arabinose dehydrogenase
MVRRLALVLSFLVFAPTADAATPVAGFTDTIVASGFSTPTAMAFLPDGRILVTEKGTGGATTAGSANLKLISSTGVSTVTTIPVCTSSEMGLLGVAVDPNFNTNGYVYIYRTAPDETNSCADSVGRYNQVMRLTMAGNGIVPGSLVQLQPGVLQMRTDGGNHDGGGLRIGPDNKLYVAVGDTGVGDGGNPGQSTNPYSQDTNALEGKVLRLELDGSPAAGNPYIGTTGRDEVWASGLRNPYRFGFDPQTGSLWLGDVGQSTVEELDIIHSGGDYAWPHCEGTLPAGCQANVPGPEPIYDPIFQYFHTTAQGTPAFGRTITAGTFAGPEFGSYAGNYFFADYLGVSGGVPSSIYRAVPNATRDGIVGTPTAFVTSTDGPVDIVLGPGGALYYVAINTGAIRMVQPAGYARPTGATPIVVRFVPAYNQCTSGNAAHGPPLAVTSCRPPVQSSTYLTVGTPDAPGNGQAAQSTGSLTLKVVGESPIDPGNGDQANVNMTFQFSDVRRKSDLLDYTGELRAVLTLRVTDRYSGPGLDTPATTNDLPFGFSVPCSATPSDATIGSNCNLTTSADAVTANSAVEGKRSVWELGQMRVFDGGADGDADTAGDNTLFAVQGTYVP